MKPNKPLFQIDRSQDANGIRSVQKVLETWLRSNADGTSISLKKAVALIRQEYSNPESEVEALLRSHLFIHGSVLTVQQPNWPEMTGRLRFRVLKPPLRLINNLARHAAMTLEVYLDEHDNDWITEEDAFALLHEEYPDLPDTEIDNLLYGEDILAGSLLQRTDVDGLKMYRMNPKAERNYDND